MLGIPHLSSNMLGLKLLVLLVQIFFHLTSAKLEPKFAPYVDVTREDEFNLVELKHKYGINAVTLAFALGGITGKCEPSWAGQLPIDHKSIIDGIKAYRAAGGEVIIATGGQAGPYLENSCKSAAELERQYERVMSLTGAKHIDIDIEATVPSDLMNQALATLQKKHSGLTVSLTLGVMGDDYGINVELGVNNVKNAVKHGVVVDIVNAMTMDFSNRVPLFGDAVIGASQKTMEQMKTIWPQKSEKELYSMLGITPMIGINDNLKVFELSHAKQLVDWAKAVGVGHLSFWSLGRDKACPGNKPVVDPGCSGLPQKEFEFTKIFQKFVDPNYHPPTIKPNTTPATHTTTHKGTHPAGRTTRRTTVTVGPMDCSTRGQTYPDPNDCQKYYVCYEGKPTVELCGAGTVWDTTRHICNFAKDANRPECL